MRVCCWEILRYLDDLNLCRAIQSLEIAAGVTISELRERAQLLHAMLIQSTSTLFWYSLNEKGIIAIVNYTPQ